MSGVSKHRESSRRHDRDAAEDRRRDWDRDAPRSERDTVGGSRDRHRSGRKRSRSPSIDRDDPNASADHSGPMHSKLAELGASRLTSDDYFARSAEFKAWLSEYKGKYLDEISSKEARRYFDKFAAKWNEGRLPDDYYMGQKRSASAPSSSQTRHRWAFTGKSAYTDKEKEQLALVRDSVDTLTNSSSRGAREAREAERRSRKSNLLDGNDEEPGRRTSTSNGGTGSNSGAKDAGWSNAGVASSASRSYADAQFDKEEMEEKRRLASRDSRSRARQDEKDINEAWEGRATGRDRLLEKRREKNAINREFANRNDDDGTLELDDRDLYGDDAPSLKRTKGSDQASSSSTRTLSKREQARQDRIEERKQEMQEKVSALKAKESQTMQMFQAMAKERFGS